MARFPTTESEIATLAQEMHMGLTANAVLYPAPPVALLDMYTLMMTYTDAKDALVAALAAAAAATDAKDAALEALVDCMKAQIRYAENTVDFDDTKLKLIGWGGRKAPTALTAPGQTRNLEAPRQGEGWVFLDWKAPSDGGKPNAYKIMRRERPSGPWEDVETAVVTEATLVDQPRGVELEYRIIAINKAGEGEPSDTEMVVM